MEGQRLEEMRDEAAAEVQSACKAPGPCRISAGSLRSNRSGGFFLGAGRFVGCNSTSSEFGLVSFPPAVNP